MTTKFQTLERDLAGNLLALSVRCDRQRLAEVFCWFKPAYITDPLWRAIYVALEWCFQNKCFSADAMARGLQEQREESTVTPGTFVAEVGRLIEDYRGLWWNAPFCARVVHDDWRRRFAGHEAASVGGQLMDGALDTDEGLSDLAKLKARYSSPVGSHPADRGGVLDSLTAPEDYTVWASYGLEDLDETAPLSPGQLVVIGARTGCGKSSFMGHVMAQNVLHAGHEGVFFSLEMSEREVYKRFAAWLSHGGNYDTELFAMAVDKIKDSRFRVIDSVRKLSQIESAIRAYPDARLVAIDYIQLVKSDTRSDTREREVAEVTNQLKQLAQETGKTILAASQLSRVAAGQHPQLHHMRESGAIEQDADIVILLHVTEEKDGVAKTVVDVAKNRNGEIDAIKANWKKAAFRYERPMEIIS